VDVTLPGEQHFYLRASTSHERQQWLVALGSAKACDRVTKDSNEPSKNELFCSFLFFAKLEFMFFSHPH
jgi:pleckstrin family protein A (phosphoinositide binding specific) protein 8